MMIAQETIARFFLPGAPVAFGGKDANSNASATLRDFRHLCERAADVRTRAWYSISLTAPNTRRRANLSPPARFALTLLVWFVAPRTVALHLEPVLSPSITNDS